MAPAFSDIVLPPLQLGLPPAQISSTTKGFEIDTMSTPEAGIKVFGFLEQSEGMERFPSQGHGTL